MRALRLTIVVTVLSALIVGCGTKGDLYIPGVPATTPWPYPTPTPKPKAPEQKPADVPATSDDKK
jgi:predicted small lipoprotein YifL